MRPSDAVSDRGPRRGTVLYLITSDISARFLRGQLGHLMDAGFDVVVGTRRSTPPAAFDSGVDVRDLPFRREPSPRADARALWATFRLIRSIRPEIVSASTPKAGVLGMLASIVARVPRRIYVCRGLRFETMRGTQRRLMRWTERLATACATDAVYNSASLLALAERTGAVRRGRGTVLGSGSGNGIDIGRYDRRPTRDEARDELGVRRDARVVGFVGRFTRDKGIVDLVDSFRDEEDVTVLLVGDFEDGDPVPPEIRREIGASPRFVHVPWVSDTSRVYPAMNVLAFPSYREGLPNVPLEAQLCGVPVVGYAATGTVDAVEDGIGGSLVDVGDVDALRQECLRQLARPGNETDADRRRAWVAERFASTVIWNHIERLLSDEEVHRS